MPEDARCSYTGKRGFDSHPSHHRALMRSTCAEVFHAAPPCGGMGSASRRGPMPSREDMREKVNQMEPML